MMLQDAPPYPSLFVGRDQELEEITQLLNNPDCRLLTLVGPGGIGKTRLALEAVGQIHFPDGVYFVPLQPLAASELIVPTIAEVLRFQFHPGGEPKEQLVNYLHDKCLLLLVDNFEHVMDGAALINDLLAGAPQVKLCVTSRERLNLLEEWVLDVGGLDYPASEVETNIESYPAVRLFLQRAQRVQVGFALSNGPDVIRICQLVDGMPLALELAASWVRTLSCAEIAAEIERSLDILETPARNMPTRHRSMRVVLDHSWSLLREDERDVFMSLSVFRGGFRKEAARQVAGATLQMLSAFVDKSMLRVLTNGRYDLQELLRQYAESKLNENQSERALVQDRHSGYYAALMMQRDSALLHQNQKVAVEEIEAEIDNVRTTWNRAVEQGRWQDIRSAQWSLYWFNHLQGRLGEGEDFFNRAAARATDPELLALLWARQGAFLVEQGHYESGRALLDKSLPFVRAQSDQREVVFTLICVGAVRVHMGLYEEAKVIFHEAEALARDLAEGYMIAWALDFLATIYRQTGRYEDAKRLLQECILISSEAGSLWLTTGIRFDLGITLQEMGHYAEAKRLYLETLQTASENRAAVTLVGYSLTFLGQVCRALHEYEEAAYYFGQALDHAGLTGIIRMKLEILAGIAELLINQKWERLALECIALIAQHPSSRSESRRNALEQLKHMASELPAEVFETHQAKGQTAELAQIIEAVYETPLFSRLKTDIALSDRQRNGSEDSLTKREIEILHLIAEGLSNREIANQLILSEGTIKWYTSVILGKLHVANRTQAAARARSLGLLV